MGTKALKSDSSGWELPTAWKGRHMAGVCELSGVQVMNSLSAENCREKAKQEMRASSVGGPGSMNVCPPISLISVGTGQGFICFQLTKHLRALVSKSGH